jgi:ferric iron reductase protein FhuF
MAVRALTTGARRLNLNSAWWQDEIGGPFPFACEVTARTTTVTVDPLIVAITEQIAEKHRVSRRVLWGNVASALNSSASMLASTRPDLADRARDEADRSLADPRIEGGTLRSGAGFRRKSCCLMYKLSTLHKPVCGDCILERG